MRYKIIEGIHHRSEDFGGVVQSPNDGLLNMSYDEYQLFLSFTTPHEPANENREFAEELEQAQVIKPIIQASSD